VAVNVLPQTDVPISLLAGFTRFFPDLLPAFTMQVPGRSVWFAVTPRQDNTFVLASADLDARTTFHYQSAKTCTTCLKRPLPRWARYAGGLTVLLAETGLDYTGFAAVVAGDDGGEGRYEYAVGLGFATICHRLAEVSVSDKTLHEYVERVRREYVTTA
jgi:galactokinase